MKIGITSESTCDLPKEYLIENNIKIIPLGINIDNKEYFDGVDINAQEIFNKVANGSSLPKTAARSIEDYIQFFTEALTECDIVLHIGFSSELSCSLQNARLAAEEVNKYRKLVYIVDSKNLSSGHGLVIMSAVDLVKKDFSVENIIEELENIIPKVRASFVINTMTYLSKGGRCSTLTSIAASILKIKPSIKVVDGKMSVSKKYMGSINGAVSKYIEDTLNEHPNCKKDKIFITYSSCNMLNIGDIEKKLIECGFENILYSTACCTISTHCGPECVGILFIDE